MATFWIPRLRIVGEDVEPAEISFGPHLNVIAGASDTGKSYIRDCINYMFGAEEPPKAVRGSAKYSTILMELETSGKNRLVLQRSLKKGGNFYVFEQNLDEWDGKNGKVLKWQHKGGDIGTLSYYLLSLCGLEAVEITKSKISKRPLSYRDIARFTLISETAIIDEWTPVYASRQNTERTANQSVFDFLISGDDASSMITSAAPAVRKASWKAKFELYGQLIDELKCDAPEDPVAAEKRLKELDATVDAITTSMTESSNAIAEEQSTRNKSWQAWHAAKSRQTVVEQLLIRFDLLGKHYKSDVERLKFLAEADHYLSQFGQEVYCPICGTLITDHAEVEHQDETASVEIKVAARVEAVKLEVLLTDLQSTVASLRDEQAMLEASIRTSYAEMQESEARLKRDLEPRLRVAKKQLESMIAERKELTTALEAQERLTSLTDLQVGLGPEPKQIRAKKGEASLVGETGPRREFLNRVAKLLKDWKYSPVGVAEFSQKMDLVIAGETRASHGKGIRAIMHAAFTLALMMQSKGRHPGLIVLDSPLTSYKGKDKYEATKDVQRGFFEYCIKYKANQIIVLENKEPDDDLKSKMHYEHFSGDKGIGRCGFYPT